MSLRVSREDIYRELVSELAGALDFIESMFDIVTNLFKKMHESLKKFPEKSELLPRVIYSMNVLREIRSIVVALLPTLLPSKEVDEELSTRYWYKHAVIAYHWREVWHLYDLSVLSTFAGAYALVRTILRLVLETTLWGVVYDALAQYEYRKSAVKLRILRAYKIDSETFKSIFFADFINKLCEVVGSRDLDNSAEVLDLLEDEKLEPKTDMGRLLEQLVDWGLLTRDESRRLHNLYHELSRYAHRAIPRFTDVGIRAIHDETRPEDWLNLTILPDEFVKTVEHCDKTLNMCLLIVVRYLKRSIVQICNKLNKEHLRKFLIEPAEYLGWTNIVNELEQLL